MHDATDELTDDALAGTLRVFQRRTGHRYSLDDTLVAWVAASARPGATHVLDLGCGIGSVLLMLAYKLPHARVLGVEALAISYRLAEHNVARNALGERVRVAFGDLRDDRFLDESRAADAFDLVTGTPPYQRPGSATPSPDPQRAHARVELRGGVEDYVRAAARVLAPGGRVVVCADARAPERVERAARAAGLTPLHALDVVPRATQVGALFTVWSLEHATPGVARARGHEIFLARDASGARTEEARAVRRFFDLPLPDDEPPSPRLRPRTR